MGRAFSGRGEVALNTKLDVNYFKGFPEPQQCAFDNVHVDAVFSWNMVSHGEIFQTRLKHSIAWI